MTRTDPQPGQTASEQQLRNAINAAQIVSWDMDLATGITSCSPNAMPLWGLVQGSSAEFMARVHPEDLARVEAAAAQAIRGERKFIIEYRVRGDGGLYRWISSRGEVIRGPTGEPERFLGFSADITHRMEAEDALRASEARFRSLAMATSDAVWTAYTDGRDGEGVAWWCGLTGQTIEETRDWGWLAAVHPEDQEAAREPYMRGIQRGEPFASEYRVRTQAGDYCHLAVRGVPVPGTGNAEWIGTFTDVSDLRRSTAALRDREQRLAAVLASIPDVIARYDREHRHIFISESVRHVTGRPASAYIGRRSTEIGERPEFARMWNGAIQRVFDTGQGTELDFEYPAPNGIRLYHARFLPERDSTGAVVSVLSVSSDITSLRKAEHSAEQSAAFHRSLGDAIPGMVWSTGPDGQLTFVNQTFTEYTGLSLDEYQPLAGSGHGLHPEDRDAVLAAFARAIEAGQPCEFEFRMRRRDGAYRWFLSRVVPVTDSAGRVLQWVGASVDIDERKRTEETVKEHDERLRMALRAAAAGTWDFDVERGQAVWSEQCCALHGSPPADQVSYEAWIALIHPDDRARTDSALRYAMEKGGDLSLEYRIIHPAHGVRWLLSIGRSVADAAGRVIQLSGLTLDINERRQVEERLRQSAKMEAIGQLAGGLAHDFNNQLHALSGLLDFVARDPGLSEESRNDLAEISNTTERMASLTHQLLAFSRQQVLVPETIDLNTAVAETRPMLQRLIGSNLEMQLDLGPDALWVKVDRTQLLQVMMNLVINARDAMPEGGRVVVRTGTRSVRGRELDSTARAPVQPGHYAELTVQDSGVGIRAEDLDRIFDAFFTTKPVGEGTGLGLATVDGILSQSKGHIWAESEPSAGSTFHVLLPFTSAPLETDAPPAPFPAREGFRGRLLVVDDEAMVREVIVRTLANRGYEVYQAVHGADALEKLEELGRGIDLVVSDVVMPVMGGAELAIRMAEKHPDVPIVWMSGYPRETVIGRGRLGEDQPFLQKPVPPAVLLETVSRALRPQEGGSPTGPAGR